ncbi:MAG: CAP domain-containing protein, partial [Microcella sp.]
MGAARGVLASLAGLMLAAALVVVPSAAQPAHASEAGTIHSLLNQARGGSGLGPLARNGALDQVALAWANQMAAEGRMYHNPNYAGQIPGGWSRAAENVAQGYPSGAS